MRASSPADSTLIAFTPSATADSSSSGVLPTPVNTICDGVKPALRAIYPSLVSQFILLTLTTSIASAISAYELTSVAQRIESDSFRSFEVYGVVTLLYLGISWLLMRMFGQISARFLSYPVR